jgi:DNA-binding NarL/FixJ family response regulator
VLELIRLDWDRANPVSRLLVVPAIFPEPTPAEIAWTRLLPSMANAKDAERFFGALADQEARDILPKVQTPTLVMATAEDDVAPREWSRMVAAAIPGASYVELPGKRHVPVRQDPNFEPYFEHLLAFVSSPQAEDPLAELSVRERDILEGVRAGLSNEAIALQRRISTKTVRNHLTRIFDKLRVNSRTQAALVATRAAT